MPQHPFAPSSAPTPPPVLGTPAPERAGVQRRRLVAVVVAPLVAAVLLVVSGGPAGPGWTAGALVVAVLVGATAATYVPDPGRPWSSRLGCTPCAGAAGAASLVALVVVASAPGDLGQAMLALAIGGAGLMQRVRGAGEACPTGPGRQG
ncbi:hypothetical protein [Cellulomonas sp. SG140]|uniref:hypothetical protein n=1 Tax=Cellulomonas sp. SG140 TaxID=2976536 RepID=UPI0021E99736|nr:hypothetical protein [Cellulomonas sp. SG140]